jgi:hypothetical protein
MVSKVEIVRPDDLLNLHVDTINLRLDLADPADPALVIDDAGRPAYLVVAFPPQAIVEEAYFESSALAQPPKDPPMAPDPAPGSPAAGKARARIGGISRLVLRVPAGKRIPYTIEGQLDWRELELSVSAIADMPEAPTPQQISAVPDIKPPTPTETAIELPYRLALSPSHDVAWVHRPGLKTSGGHTELWHTRLAHRDEAGGATPISRTHPAPLRAIWSPDYNANRFWNTDPPRMGEPDSDWGVLTAMTPSDRHEIVVATSAFRGYIKGIGLGGSAGKPLDFTSFLPTPFHAEQLILSGLGGWLKSRGQWSPPMPWRIKPWVILPPIEKQWSDLVGPIVRRRIDPLPDRGPEPPRAAPPPLVGPLAATPVRAAVAGTEIADTFTINDSLFDLGMLGEAGSSHNLSEWSHIATQGRDHYVRIVYEGFVYRWHHRAALIKVTERKVKTGADGAPVAYLSQQMFVIIRQPLMDFSGEALADPRYGRHMPFRRVWLKTTDTPAIDKPEPIAGVYSFWIKVDGKPFRFDAIGEDFEGNLIPFTTSLIFVPFSDYNAVTVQKIRPQHERAVADRACPVPGRRMAFAPRLAGQATDNTNFTTNVLHFTSDDGGASGALKFRPVMHKAEVRLPAVEQLLGKETTTAIAYYQNYLDYGFDGGNKTGLFAYIAKETVPSVPPEKPADPPTARPTLSLDKVGASFSADQAGGISTPNLSISGITRNLGPLAGDDLGNLADNAFNPADFFKDVKDSVKLFGSIPLIELLVGGSMEVGAPKVQMSTEDVAGSPSKKKVVATLMWMPQVKNAHAGIVELQVDNGTKLAINGRVERIVEVPPAGAPGPTTALFEGELTNFTIDLLNIVALRFDAFRFSSKSGSKPAISVALKDPDPLEFEGDLKFVNELKKFIPPGLFGDGASLDVSPTRVKAGFGIGLPPIAIGVFSLQNVALNAGLELPFLNGKPLFDFGISAREHPFCLTVAFLGGGGFFHLQVDTDGVRLLEAALEFGAAVSVNLGVASGGVHIMAGVYFAMGKKEGKDFSILSGYLRMGGELSVLGLISVSLEFVLSFGYEAGKAAGRATLTVKVEVLFFSTSVSITVEKKFGGSSGDPRFFQVFETPAVWNEYASAFA